MVFNGTILASCRTSWRASQFHSYRSELKGSAFFGFATSSLLHFSHFHSIRTSSFASSDFAICHAIGILFVLQNQTLVFRSLSYVYYQYGSLFIYGSSASA